jgi:hypothetical protein
LKVAAELAATEEAAREQSGKCGIDQLATRRPARGAVASPGPWLPLRSGRLGDPRLPGPDAVFPIPQDAPLWTYWGSPESDRGVGLWPAALAGSGADPQFVTLARGHGCAWLRVKRKPRIYMKCCVFNTVQLASHHGVKINEQTG